jgi:peptide/nickel transport system substrate-binding protein
VSTQSLPGVGSTFGPYRIDALLGRGGMGVVYRAEDLRLQRSVALKLLSAQLSDDLRFRERFLRESRLAAATEHPGIVPVYEAGEIDGRLYIAMRCIDGADLGGLLRREGPLEPVRAVVLVAQLAAALDAAHARGLVHRDVKPSNALVSRDADGERVYLLDFGVTESTGSHERLTATGQFVGTVDYLAPERIRGESADSRADLYALGCVLFECLTGEVPFPRESEAAAMYAHLEDEPPQVSERRPGLPTELDAVVARALAKDPAERWQTGAELAAAARKAVRPDDARAVGAHARGSRARRTAAAGLALLAVAVAAAAALELRSDDSGRPAVIDGNEVGLIDAGAGDITEQFAVGPDPSALVVGGGSVWAASERADTVSRIDGTGHPIVTIPVPGDPAGMTFAAGSLWVANREGRSISQIDPGSNRVVGSVEVGNAPRAVAAGFGALWVASDVDRKLARVDLARGVVTAQVDLGGNATSVATGAGAVWVASEEAGSVFRIEPGAHAVSGTIEVGNGPAAVVAADGAVWVANRQDGTVSRIDPGTEAVTKVVPVGPDPTAIAAGEGGVWVADSGNGTVVRVDTTTGRVAETIHVGNPPSALAVADGSVWTAARASPASHDGGTLRIEMQPYETPMLEPSRDDTASLELLSLAHDGLVAYRRTDSSTYGPLVGGLAVDVPDPSPDGRTYVFKLRRGLRYSDGSPVRPDDFRASLEAFLRQYRRVPYLPPFYEHIVGASGCMKHPGRCDLSQGIVTDASAGTITIRLNEPDPDLLDKLAYPFAYVAPADHPFQRNVAPPSTGPYRIVSFDPRRGARLVRNPYFRARGFDARPNGLADEIRFQFRDNDRRSFDAAVAAVERGESDVVEVSGKFGGRWSPKRIAALAVRTPGRLYTDATAETEYMFLNVRTPPFDDPRVRQAINYAVDRGEVARRAGGPDLAQLTCQLVPPGFPSYKPSCPYTANPDPGGGWSRPDIDRARRLIEQSGTKGTRVTVWSYSGLHAITQYFVSLLHSLGYRSSLREFRLWTDYAKATTDARSRVQIGTNGWASDIAVPADFTTLFRCRMAANFSRFCDRRLEDRIEGALATRGTQADAAWQAVYRRLSEAAPLVPLVNRRTLTLVSKRVGNYEHHPLWGALYDRMWVR